MTDQLKRAIHEAKTAKTTSNPTDKAGASSEEQNFDMSESTYKTTHTAVRKARRFAMQGLYEWLVTDRRFETTDKLGWKDNAPHDIAARTRATNAMHTVHIGYYHEMMRDIPEQIETLDALIEQHLDRKVEQLDTVEHAILLIGAYELQNRLEIPYKVVLDEAMKLNNHFGATDAHKLINAVLDKMAIDLRDLEVQADIKANRRSSQKAAGPAAQPQPQTTDETKAVTNADDTSETPATTGKPRISANKAIKRPRANKAQANISDYRASKKASAQGHNEAAATPTPESTAADVGLHDSNLVNSDEKSKE
ncbi:transcription antitermination factor NusB [Psychrobacter sp. Marseille-P5312]|uniref:transcription antitermination factor NusB n=1 Tax=Psychrobacter sp. Marseille-P5312 TaxID=2086574 RepID=UPI000CF63596|nr:transcription antitermination factor NusB [Psychrobacter sp. Marseille-P5312]